MMIPCDLYLVLGALKLKTLVHGNFCSSFIVIIYIYRNFKCLVSLFPFALH
jgi:hypothetical protein